MNNVFNRVSFIGRVKELQTIENYLKKSHGEMFVTIEGIGGIGKTRLLEEVYNQFSDDYKICKIIDFDNNYFQIQGSIITHIANELKSEEYFHNYFELQKDYERHEKELNVGELTLKEHNKILNRIFIEEFNRYAQESRVTIVFDTLDKLDLKAIPYLEKLFRQLKNRLVLLAGRHENIQRLRTLLPSEKVLNLELQKFSEDEIESYIQKKRINSSIRVNPETQDKIAILSRGKPILIDLAIDRIGIKNSIEWLERYSVDDIMFANRHEKEEFEKKFENDLISDIVCAETKIDEYILLLSLMRQANRMEIEEILELDAVQRENIFEYSKNSVVFKNIDNSEVALHDEISRMLDLYISKSGTFPKRDEFITRSIDVLEQELEEVNLSLSNKAFTKQRLLRLKLYQNVESGIHYFIHMFDEEFKRGLLFKYIKPLIQNIEVYIDKVESSELKSELIIRVAHYYMKDGKYDYTYALLTQEYSQDLSAENRVQLLLSLVNAKIRIGKVEEAIQTSQQAILISQETKNRQLEAKALNVLGWAYRSNGKLNRAIEHYLKANQLVEEYTQDRESQKLKGWIHNNLAFAYAQKGNIKSATRLADIAQSIWKRLSFRIGLGALYEVYGEIYLKYGYYDQAISYYDKAINIFIERGDKDFSKRAFVERATANIHAKHFTQAKDDLQDAIDIYIDISSIDVRLQYEKAYVATYEGQFSDAYEALEKAIEIHEFHPNPEYMLFTLYLKLVLAIETKNLERGLEVKVEYEAFKVAYPDSKYYLVEAIIFKKFADILLLQNMSMKNTLEYYKKSFSYFKSYGESEPYSLYNQLNDLDRIFKDNAISSNKIKDIGQSFCSYWQECSINEIFPETLHILSFWKEGKVEGV